MLQKFWGEREKGKARTQVQGRVSGKNGLQQKRNYSFRPIELSSWPRRKVERNSALIMACVI